jgi:cytidine deaminase
MTTNRPDIVAAGDIAPFIEGWHDIRSLPSGFNLRSYVVQSLCRIVDLSQQAVEELGQSYRGFKVGSAILALDSNGLRTGTYFGGNLTPYKGADWNCAEKRAFETVQQRGFDTVLAIAVTGPVQPDENSGVQSPTLHPCQHCRGLLASSPLVHNETLIATSNLEHTEFELFTRNSLLALHQTGQPQPFPDYHPMLPVYWDQLIRMEENSRIDREELMILSQMANR